MLALASCGNDTSDSSPTPPVSNQNNTGSENPKPVETNKGEEYSIAMFDELMATMPITVVSTHYVVQDEQHKTLYPDILQVIIKNNTKLDIKDAVVAFVAWDKNQLPVKIKGSIDFSDGSYIKLVNYSDINLVPDSQFGDSSGFQVDENCNIASFKCIVTSYTTFDGVVWENPYTNNFTSLYEGKKYSDDLSTEVIKVTLEESKDENPEPSNKLESEPVNNLAMTELDEVLKTQELAVTQVNYLVQNEQHKTLYPDMLQAIIKNNTQLDIKNAVVCFVAWDINNLPIKLKGSIDFSDGAYIKPVNFTDINLVPNEEFGHNSGFEIDENSRIHTFKAIVKSYEAFDGSTWENPHYSDFISLYEGVKLQ